MRVPQSMWYSGCASGKSVAVKEINNRLDEIRATALSVYAEQSAIRDFVSAEEVKGLLLGMASEQETLLSYFRQFIENFARRVGVNHVVRFLQIQYNLLDILFTTLDRSFIGKYDLYLRTEHNLVPGTIINLTVKLKTIVGETIADGISTIFVPVSSLRLKVVIV